MRNRNNPVTSGEGQAAIDPDSDRYPNFFDVLRKLIQDDNVPDGPIERVEIAMFASGDAAWRVWPSRADEYIGGFYDNSEF